jgi:hypothetical protein
MNVRRTPTQALAHFRSTGQHDLAEMLAQVLEGERAEDPRAQRRRAMFPPDVVDFLEGLDRRRVSARRLAPICEDQPHVHGLGCRDPLGQVRAS